MKRAIAVIALFAVIATTLVHHQTIHSNFGRKSPAQTATTLVPPVQKPIVTTMFWAGEAGSSDNQYISNASSAWDENWMVHFGGVDDPAHRNGFSPSSFTPKENPFYVALPYNDVGENGFRKSSAKSCANAANPLLKHYSWCKNSWVAVTAKGKTVYAQWEDVGPYEENDVNYVFGNSNPLNKVDPKAGLDVSPAVHDYLQLQDVDTTSWKFVAADQVPPGPWKTTITIYRGDRLD